MKNSSDIRELLTKYQENRCSQEEKLWVEEHFVQYTDRETKDFSLNFIQNSKKKSWAIICSSLGLSETRVKRIQRIPVYGAIAASLVMFFFIGIKLFENIDNNQQQRSIIEKSKVPEGVVPGGNKATLSLSDGRKIPLDGDQYGIVVESQDIKYMNGVAISMDLESMKTGILTLSTPKGGQYQLTLSDGTQVWLNAASKISYPAQFNGGEREIYLEGEAYFKVTKHIDAKSVRPNQRIPFIVKTPGQIVKVVGTEFSVSAYPEIGSTKTTLVNGALLVAGTKNSNLPKISDFRDIMPGQQSIVLDGHVQVREANIENEIAWRNDKISLEGKTVEQILPEIARWYDLNVVYEGIMPQETFFGRIDRSKNLAAVLHFLESANLTYRIEGRDLIVNSRTK